MSNKIWTLRIADPHLAIVLGAIQERPFKDVYRLIESITAQMREQQKAPEVVAANGNEADQREATQ